MNLLLQRSTTYNACNLPKAVRPLVSVSSSRRHFSPLLSRTETSLLQQRHRVLQQTPCLLAATTRPLFPRVLFSSSAANVQKRLDEFQDLFVEARLCIEDANDSAGTKYFEEDAQAAMDAVQEAVDFFEKLVNDVEDKDEKNRILRSNGLKVEQLKGELEMMLHGGNDH